MQKWYYIRPIGINDSSFINWKFQSIKICQVLLSHPLGSLCSTNSSASTVSTSLLVGIGCGTSSIAVSLMVMSDLSVARDKMASFVTSLNTSIVSSTYQLTGDSWINAESSRCQLGQLWVSDVIFGIVFRIIFGIAAEMNKRNKPHLNLPKSFTLTLICQHHVLSVFITKLYTQTLLEISAFHMSLDTFGGTYTVR